MKTFIVVKNTFEGIHKYNDAPEEVIYLRKEHRHLFTVKSKIQVFNDDRELEFIMVKHEINKYLKCHFNEQDCYELNNKSCEQIAYDVYMFLKKKYGIDREISIEVSEDNENSAIIEEEK